MHLLLFRFLPRLGLAASLGLALILGGCMSLPPLADRAPTAAITDTVRTALGRIERASLQGAAPGESGFRLLPTGDFAFDARLALVRRAERAVDVQYYQIKSDGIGLRFLRELRDAARRGVRVRVLVDDLYVAGNDGLFYALAAVPNVEVRLFNPLPARGATVLGRILFSLPEFGRINHRMHNKLLVADNRFAVSGGRNLADEYFMRSTAANFIDMDVVSTGPVVRELSGVFDLYWNSVHAYPVQSIVRSPLDIDAARRHFEELVEGAAPDIEPAAKDVLDRPSVEAELGAGRLSVTTASAEVFADSPMKVERKDRGESVSTVNRSVLEAITTATSQVTIATPYLIPGPIGLQAMRDAKSRGVRVTVLTNSLGATDEPLVHWRYARYRRDMLRLGVQIYELSPELASKSGDFGDFGKSFGRLHAKVVAIDRHLVFIGSMNFDPRSAWSNTEMGLLIESPELCAQVLALALREPNTSVYRLRMAADDETIEWVTVDSAGKETVLNEEPHSSWQLRLKMWLLEPFTSEELL